MKKNMKKTFDAIRFVLKCILIPAASVFVIYMLNKPYKEINDQKYLDILKFDMLGREYWEIHIANLGSSHGAYDFVYDDITAKGLTCFNFGNTSQSYNYDYAILKEFGQYMETSSVLFIPVSYFSFNNEVVNEAEVEAMSLRYYHFLSPKNIPDYDPYIDIITNRLPILSAGRDILKLFPNINPSLIAHAAENGINVEEFARRAQERYSRHFENKQEYFLPERIEELYAIIDYCHEHQITPVLITTPFSKYYTDLVADDFLAEFQKTVTKIATDTQTSYYDYSNDSRFHENLEYFSDSDHLNATGAAYFMKVLWDEIDELKLFQ